MSKDKISFVATLAPTLPETQLLFGKILREINDKLITQFDYKKTLDFVFESLNIIIPYDRIGIALLEGEGETSDVCSKWVRSKIPNNHLNVGYCARLQGSSLQKIIETGQPRIINDLVQYAADHQQSISTKLIIKDGIRSSLTCPLRLNGNPVGIVFFSSTSTDTYKKEHVQTYLDIADELSLIVEHGRLRNSFENSISNLQNQRMMIHDLRSPLSVIQGYLDLIMGEDGWVQNLDPDAKKAFATLKRNTSHMFDLIDELSELRQHAKIKQEQVISLREFISELATSGQELTDAKEIGFSITTDAGLPLHASFDSLKIRRIYDNLITNAVKYSYRHTVIQAHIKFQPGRLIFEVSDQGQGIPDDELPKIFHEFEKTSVRPTEGETSTGLGLAIVKKYVEECGGQISVRSQVGQGSTFTFWIPLDQKNGMH